MKKKLNELLVSSIRNSLPEEVNMVSFLMEELSLGKESVYRRIRNEIPFTFEEISHISSKLGFSIDEIVGNHNKGRVFFDLHLQQEDDTNEIYAGIIKENTDLLKKLRVSDNSNMSCASNRLPIFFSIPYEYLSKFRFYKWKHQTREVPLNFYFSDFNLFEQLMPLYKQFAYNYRNIKNITLIMDNKVFLSIINDINYFYKRNLINQEEFLKLQEELLKVVDDIEGLAQKGKNEYGSQISLYVSSLNIESNFSYCEYDDNRYSQFWTYTFDPITVYNPDACYMQKNWLDSLKKYSTLITKCGEIQRSEFLNEQRNAILSISK